MRHEGTLLALEEAAVFFERFKCVPYTFRNVHAVAALVWTKDNTFYHAAVIVMRRHLYPSSKQHKGFIFCRVTMYRNDGTRFHRIQKAMAGLIETLVEVVVHP